MKEWHLTLSMLVLVVLLTACNQPTNNGNSGATSNGEQALQDNAPLSVAHVHSAIFEDFKLEIVSPKASYNAGETISIHAKLTYIGDKSHITIGHAMYPVGFYLYEKSRELYVYGAMAEPYIETTLEKDVPVVYELNGLGGYSDESNKEEKKFNEATMTMKWLKGNYDVYAAASFVLPQIQSENNVKKNEFEVKLPITVK